jgi:mannose/fructose/N-acetylgalactosamine-specific phosphotransferase system component IIB
LEDRLSVELYRIDDRLIHGQVVVGWGQPLGLRFIVVVDDIVATNEWEQDLYQSGVPPHMEVIFCSVEEARRRLPEFELDPRPGLVLTGDIDTMSRLQRGGSVFNRVNLGGIHARSGRVSRMRYVYLSSAEEAALQEMAASGVIITAQDLPATRPVQLDQVLSTRLEG